MARYTIDFSTNASRIASEIQKVNEAITGVTKKGRQSKITLELDTTKLRTSIDSTFRQLDKQIAAMQRKLAGMQIGSRRFQQQATGIGVAQGMRERGGMQARAIQLGAQAEAFDIGSATRLTKQLEAARIEASQIAPNTEPWINLQRQIGRLKVDLQAADRLAENVQMRESLGAFEPGSLNALEAKLTILRNRAREIAPSATEWKNANREIVKTEQLIEKQTRRPLTTGQRMGAAGGAFLYGGGLGGGVGSAVGGIAGGLMGGVPGAFTGAAIGQLTDNIGAMMASVTQGAATIAQLQRGLALASIDAKDFAEAQQAVVDSSNRLVVPLEQVYRQFTQLRVNTKQYGLTVRDTQEILEGTALAVSSVGGSAEDVEGAMRAVVQILSKGGVQAEEIRGQLGERFPGAVVKFAQVNNWGFGELQQRLQEGEVGIKEFVKFAKENYEDYAGFTEQLATAPEFAGRRLAKAMADMQLAIGSALGPAGAIFQDFFTETIQGFTGWVNQNKEFIGQYLKDWAVFVTEFARIVGGIVKIAINVSTTIMKVFSAAIREIRRLLGMVGVAEIKAELDRVNAQIAAGGGGRRRGAAQSGLETRRQQLQAQFAAAGGQAALDAAASPAGGDFVFGGPGAGMSLDSAGGKAPKEKKGKELDTYNRSQFDFIKQQFEAEKQVLDQQLQANLLSKTSYDIKLAELTLETERAELQERFRLESEKIKNDNLSAADKALAIKDQEVKLANGLAIAEKQRDIAIKGAKLELRKPFVDALRNENMEIDKQQMILGNLKQGYGELTAEQEANLIIEDKTRELKAEQQKLIETEIENLREVTLERIKAARALQIEQTIKGLRDQLALLRAVSEEEQKRLRIAQENKDATAEQLNKIYDLEKVRDNIKAVREIIDSFVTDTSSDYKGFLKEVISGEDAVDSLKKFQEALKDRTLTVFLDFAMAPVEKFFKEGLSQFAIEKFFPKGATENMPEGAKPSTTPIEAQDKNTTATDKNTAALDANTAAKSATSSAPQSQAMGGLAQGFLAQAGTGMGSIGAYDWASASENMDASLSSVVDSINKNAEEAGPNGSSGMKFSEALGKTVQGIGIAAGAIMGIMAGVNQIKEGGTSNVLGGIGSILLGVGGAIGGFAGMIPKSGKAANGAVWKGGFTAFANGGVVSGPTLGLIGEGKYNEAIVPLPDGKSIPVQLGGASSRELLSGGSRQQQAMPMLSMSFQTTKFGDREYVDIDQLQAAMAETRKMAARDGANRGASLALDKLQNSPSARRKVGMR